MRYCLEGGKRVRGFLVIESAAVFDLRGRGPDRAGAAIECLHAYSLAHDDLPCMDDDDFRRGKPSLHKAFNETVAVLTGDALQCTAFWLLAGEETSADPQIRSELVFTLATASGADGMVLGQCRDLEVQAAHAELTEDEVMSLHAKKTGALLSWSVQAGAILAGEDPTPMRVYGDAIGLAYQIVDDLLDADQPGSEDASILHALGVEGARTAAANKIDEACDALVPYGDKADTLRELAQFVVERQL